MTFGKLFRKSKTKYLAQKLLRIGLVSLRPHNYEIKTKEEYNQTIARVDLLFDAPKGSEEANELNLLVLVVNKYEAKNYPIDEPDPIAYIKIRREESSVI